MRKLSLLTALCIIAFAFTANAQVHYQSPEQHRQSMQSSSQSQTVRTTAYYQDSYGNYVKVPIQVKLQSDAYGNERHSVISYYENAGIGGYWRNVDYGGSIQKCNSALGGNQLERQFMYKAFVNARWYYFDL